MSKPELRAANRRRAFTALAEAVGERGYSETTVADVLVRARMSRRTFYELFDNREQCFLAAYDDTRHGALAPLECPREPEAPWPDQFSALLRGVLEYLAARPDFARLLIVDSVSIGPAGIERHEETLRALAERLARCRRPDGVAMDAGLRLRCEASIGAAHRVIQARLLEGRARELPALAPDLARLIRDLAGADDRKRGLS